LPMGARLRLKATKDISSFTPEMQRIFRAMKKYGLIMADNGSDMYITGTYDTRWNNDILNPAFAALTASDFEVIQLGYNPAPPTTAALSSLAVSPTSVIGGSTATGTITLTGPAPAAGALVALSSSTAAVTVPPSVTIGSGVTSMTFQVSTTPVASPTNATLSASYAGTTKTAGLAVAVAPTSTATLSTLTLNPTVVNGGTSSTATVTLSGPAPTGGAGVALSSSKPSTAATPASVTVPSGLSSVTFSVSTLAVSSNTSAVISATYGGKTVTATLTVRKRKR
jgi:hypothetical protein